MPESHAASRWPYDPARVTYPQVVRHLAACAPCAESLAETIRSPRPGARVARRERSGPTLVDTVLGRALSSGDGQAAVLLYDMARASLRQIEPYASEIEWTEEPAPFMDLRADVCTLSKRLRDGDARLEGLPQATPAVAVATEVADRCLDLAERFAPGWGWVGFERAQVRAVHGELSVALESLMRVQAAAYDPRVSLHAARNAAMVACAGSDWSSLSTTVEVLENCSRLDPATRYFAMRSCIRDGLELDPDEVARSVDRFVDAVDRSASRFWATLVGLELLPVLIASETAAVPLQKLRAWLKETV